MEERVSPALVLFQDFKKSGAVRRYEAYFKKALLKEFKFRSPAVKYSDNEIRFDFYAPKRGGIVAPKMVVLAKYLAGQDLYAVTVSETDSQGAVIWTDSFPEVYLDTLLEDPAVLFHRYGKTGSTVKSAAVESFDEANRILDSENPGFVGQDLNYIDPSVAINDRLLQLAGLIPSGLGDAFDAARFEGGTLSEADLKIVQHARYLSGVEAPWGNSPLSEEENPATRDEKLARLPGPFMTFVVRGNRLLELATRDYASEIALLNPRLSNASEVERVFRSLFVSRIMTPPTKNYQAFKPMASMSSFEVSYLAPGKREYVFGSTGEVSVLVSRKEALKGFQQEILPELINRAKMVIETFNTDHAPSTHTAHRNLVFAAIKALKDAPENGVRIRFLDATYSNW